MEELLAAARRSADYVEVFTKDTLADEVVYENSRLKYIESSRRAGVGLTLIKDGRLGYAFTRNLIDRDELVANALAAMAGGVEAGYDAAPVNGLPTVDSYDASITGLTTEAITDECERICGYFAGRTTGELDVFAGREIRELRAQTSAGTDARSQVSSWYAFASLRYPGSHSSVHRVVVHKGFKPMPDAVLEYVLETYERSVPEVTVEPGKMRVLFVPEAMFGFAWRLQAAASGKNVYKEVSPLRDRVGSRVLSPLLTFENLPLDDAVAGARPFDDEGTPCRNAALIEDGVLKGFFYDRYYAWRAGTEPTGNGFRSGIGNRVAPSLEHCSIRAGDKSLAELYGLLGRGIVVVGAMGAHSGNMLNGDYSIGLAPGLYVEGGEIVGRVKDAMVAGNVYETLANVVAVGDTLHPAHVGRFPAVLCDNVSFAMRS